MFLKYVFLACVICTVSRADIFDKPKTNIYYETLDQNSIDFFKDKFQIYYHHLSTFLEFNLVPFGKAKLTKKGATEANITCEHGEVECYGNRVHACALQLLTNTDEKIEFVVCTMNHTNPKTVTKDNYPAKKCIQMLNFDLSSEALDQCIKSESTKLLEKYENETKHLQTTINVLPVITLNEEPFDAQTSDNLVRNFQEAVCQKLMTDVPAAAAVCGNISTTTHSPNSTTTPRPNSATIVSTAYWPLFVAIVLTVLFEVKSHY